MSASNLASGLGLVLVTTLACARPALPDPRAAAAAYAVAAEQGDAEALYGMLSESARTTYGREGTERVVADARPELARRGRALAQQPVQVEAAARLRFADGEQAELTLEDGEFRITSAGVLPAGAGSPEQALDELRRALAWRSYPALLRVLSTETRGQLEGHLSALVEGLEHPEALDVKVDGDRATVVLPGGHLVRLRREEGVWRVEDVE